MAFREISGKRRKLSNKYTMVRRAVKMVVQDGFSGPGSPKIADLF